MKVLRNKLAIEKTEITKLENTNGQITTNKQEILEIVKDFYSNLYGRNEQPVENTFCTIPRILNQGSEDLPKITTGEVLKSLSDMKNSKAPGEDDIVIEAVKEGGDMLLKAFGTLDFYQPPEQAGFRCGYGTNNHLQVIKTLIEKSVEYNKPLVLVFVDYEKAFDSIKHNEMFRCKALADCRVDYRYSAILQHIYKHATASNTELEGLGINVDGENLNHLRFADDIVLITDCLGKAGEMLLKLTSASHKVGLKINDGKTQFMTNLVPSRNILLEGKEILQVTSYKYLGYEIRVGRDNQTCEIERRIRLTWAAYGKLKHIFKSEIPICFKRKVFDQSILPVLTYDSETSTLTLRTANRVRVAQRAMERSMLGITMRDRVPTHTEQKPLMDVQ
ncbi:uncharacterized protein LOC115232884 [Formica exsecta]|uniref:uncharacterized protein LOC115232884 n=1 Tax=Formica exsecta TaxID=72781 RepID=UPI001142C3F4|nr:uncharacterized protein LOC115232884 [Formica exsecta]